MVGFQKKIFYNQIPRGQTYAISTDAFITRISFKGRQRQWSAIPCREFGAFSTGANFGNALGHRTTKPAKQKSDKNRNTIGFLRKLGLETVRIICSKSVELVFFS